MGEEINPNMQDVTMLGPEVFQDIYWLPRDTLHFLQEGDRSFGFWTYGKNRKQASEERPFSLHLEKKPPWRTRWFLSLFGIYWIDKK